MFLGLCVLRVCVCGACLCVCVLRVCVCGACLCVWCVCLCVRLRAAQDQLEVYKRKVDVLDDYEGQVRLLRDEVIFLTAEKSMLQER